MDSSLPRRVFLGVSLAPPAERFAPTGLRVAGVLAESTAHLAGVAPGDVLVRFDGMELSDADALARALRAAAGKTHVELELERAGSRSSRRVELVERPREVLPSTTVLYASITSGGARLRTIITHPDGAEKRPAVLFLQGISAESIDLSLPYEEPTARLIHGWARAGFVTMRLERRGLGDSEGGPFEHTVFEQEVSDYRAALDALLRLPFVAPGSVFVFGHSVGGMIAPLLARDTALRGVMVYGTAATPWLECLAASSRRQLALRGVPGAEIEAILARERAALGVPPDERSLAYHQQLHHAELARAWHEVACEVLVLHGEHDWVVGNEEQAQLMALLAARDEGGARLLELPGLDHAMMLHRDRASSLSAYGRGAPDASVLDATRSFIDAPRMDRSPA